MSGYLPYPYPPPYPTDPKQDPLLEAERYYKKLRKVQRKATEAEAAKHKDKVSRPKSRFEKLDVLHAMLGMFLFMLFVGPFIGLAQVTALKHYMEALNALFK